ncbi:MAG TPA: hypothetical protein PLF61_00480 [Candidatus Goldiibacteriota bacterium]|nr:hypothetical protein [Candidatus Goldiibacteriota bacterium]
MAQNKIEGKHFYLRVTEPVKFLTTIIKNIQESEKKGFKVKVFLGGPDTFPANTFEGTDIGSKRFLLFIYGISYWTHIAFDVKGKTEYENEREIDNILAGMEGEVSPF